MNRKIYKFAFTKEHVPAWLCPACEEGVLLLEPASFIYKSASLAPLAYWEQPPWENYVYSCFLVCSNNACATVVSNIGTGRGEDELGHYNERGEHDEVFVRYFYPKYFQPHLKLFSIPKNTPEDVTAELQQSFSLFFCNPASSLNHARIALENLLTCLKVKRTRIGTKNGKRKRFDIPLHNRIELLPTKHQNLKEHLLAVKWLGNAGSHAGTEITMDDVMDAYEIMSDMLNELFENKQKRIKKLVKAINKKKGPNS